MGATFTITQQPDSTDLWLYPNSSSVTELIAFGAVENYECIDENRTVPDLTTYVYTDSVSAVSDLYGLPNHTTETGTINSIAVYIRAKSHLYNQNSTGTYDILIWNGETDPTFGTPINVFNSSEATYGDDINLTTGYSNHYCTWTSNPTTNIGWQWHEIDSLLIGIKSSSPSITTYGHTLTLRPTGAGDTTEHEDFPVAGSNYEKVDEVIADNYTTYLFNRTSVSKIDLYHITDTTQSGTIQNVEVLAKWRNDNYNYPTAGSKLWNKIKTGGVEYRGDSAYSLHGDGWQYTSYSWASNPSDSVDWVWGDINSLQIGIETDPDYVADDKYGARTTQVYAILTYDDTNVNPEIRTTQCHVKVNYTSAASFCYPLKPETYTFGHTREVKKQNTWAGKRYVYDLQRSSKTLSMSGVEYNRTENTAIDTLNCIKTMKDNGNPITISGMNDQNLNTTWLIKNFNYTQDENNPSIYRWNMEAEKK